MCIRKNAAHEHTGEAEAVRPSLRNGLTAYTCSPWRPGFLVTITGERLFGPYRRLDAYPGASGPHDFADASTPLVRGIHAPIATCSNLGDDGRRPLFRNRMDALSR